MSQAQKNLRGIVAMTLAMAFFALNDALVKLARVHWDTGQILVIRGTFALGILAVWLSLARLGGQLSLLRHPKLLLRGIIEGFVACTFIAALGAIPLAEITTILMLAPMIITALSTVFFSEKVGWRRWSAVAVGFSGMLLVVRPGGDLPLAALVLALASVIGVGFRDILTRAIPSHIPSAIVAVTSTLGTLTGGLLLSLQGGWKPMTAEFLMLTSGAAGLVALGNYAMIEACRGTELSAISPFRYVVIVWAVVLGIIVFGDWPSPLALIGIVLICGSGLYTLHRERVRRKSE